MKQVLYILVLFQSVWSMRHGFGRKPQGFGRKPRNGGRSGEGQVRKPTLGDHVRKPTRGGHVKKPMRGGFGDRATRGGRFGGKGKHRGRFGDKRQRGRMIGGRGMAGGWRRSSVNKMMKHLSYEKKVYNNEELNNLKKKTFDGPGTWIANFILNLEVDESASTEMVNMKKSKIVKVKKVRKQVVAGTNYMIDVLLENKERFRMRIFVSLPFKNEDPIIQSVEQVVGRKRRQAQKTPK